MRCHPVTSLKLIVADDHMKHFIESSGNSISKHYAIPPTRSKEPNPKVATYLPKSRSDNSKTENGNITQILSVSAICRSKLIEGFQEKAQKMQRKTDFMYRKIIKTVLELNFVRDLPVEWEGGRQVTPQSDLTILLLAVGSQLILREKQLAL